MFWQSVIDGFKHIFNWRIFVVGIGFIILSFIIYFIVPFVSSLFLAYSGKHIEEDEDSTKSKMYGYIGCLSMFLPPFIQLFLQTLLIIVSILLITPIMISGYFPPLNIFSQMFVPILKIGLIVSVITLIITLIISIIPIINGLIDVPFVPLYIQGIIAFQLTFGAIFNKLLNDNNLNINIYPNFWNSAGFLIITLLTFFIFMLIISVISSVFMKDTKNELTALIMPVICPAFTLLPLLMYISYILNIIKSNVNL